jgi:predicted patatin/cPLA2 family phospholipase
MKAQLEGIKDQLRVRTEQEAMAADMATEKALSKDLVLWRRKLDELRNKTQTKRQQLQMLQDKQKELESMQMDLNSDDNPQMKQIRRLENELDKTMIKYNEALSLKKTYETILDKLTEERTSYES